MFAQFFILNLGGDIVVFKDYTGVVSRGPELCENFYQRIPTDGTPFFTFEDTTFCFKRSSGLYFVVSTLLNVSPFLCFEFINRVRQLIKDFCGGLSEEFARRNSALIYEILDEILDYGVIQGSSVEKLKSLVYTEPVVVGEAKSPGLLDSIASLAVSKNSVPAQAARQPLAGGQARAGGRGGNDIYVDLIERLSVVLDHEGAVVRSSVSGAVKVRSRLYGNPPIRVAFNTASADGAAAVHLDDCVFHDNVDATRFDADGVLECRPLDGEFDLLKYRAADLVSADTVPFVVLPVLEAVSASRVDVTLTLYSSGTCPAASNVELTLPLPRSAASVSFDVPHKTHSADYISEQRRVIWKIGEFPAGAEFTLKVKVITDGAAAELQRDIVGPALLNFDIPLWTCSGFDMRYLKVVGTRPGPDVSRWIRSLTRAGSYVVRLPS